jgi:hypothetical protein
MRCAPLITALGILAAVPLAGSGGGCRAPRPEPSLASENPQALIPAIRGVAEDGELSAAPALVASLESDDPAVRLYAIEALERMTGRTLGYRYYADAPARRDAVARWRRWLNDGRVEPARAAGSGGDGAGAARGSD